jgi:hypothetical protein
VHDEDGHALRRARLINTSTTLGALATTAVIDLEIGYSVRNLTEFASVTT